jgi:O-antigen/teichoic acid export membrane protein
VLEEAKRLLRFGIFIFLDAILWSATPRLFGFLIGYFQGVQAAGLVHVAFRINDAICSVISAVSARLALPLFSQLAHDRPRLAAAFTKGTRLTFLLAAPVFTGVALVSREIVALLLGPLWTASAFALSMVCLASVANFARLLAQPVIKALGQPQLLLWLHVVGLLFVSTGSLATAHSGLNGQLLVWVAFGLVYLATSVALLRRASGMSVRDQLAPLAPAALASLGMAAGTLALVPVLANSPTITAFAIQVTIGAAIYITLAAILEWPSLSAMAGPWLRLRLGRVAQP